MSGIMDAEIRRQREKMEKYHKSLAEKRKLRQRINEVKVSVEKASLEINNNINQTINMLDKKNEVNQQLLKKITEDKNRVFENFKIETITAIEEMEKNLNKICNNNLSDYKEKIRNSNEKLEIMQFFADAKVTTDFIIQEIEEEEKKKDSILDILGIESKDDINDKYAFLDIYQQFTELGYNPVYDPESNRLIVEKDNGTHIVANMKEDCKLGIEFLSYEGKSCSKDMRKIEKSLRNNKSIEDDERVYTKWYTTAEQEKYESSEVQSTNTKIYQKLQKNKVNIKQNHQ